MRQILLFAALAASLALLSGCALSEAKADTAEDMTGKAAYHKISAEEAYEMMASQEVVVVDCLLYTSSKKRGISRAMVVLPPPEGPTSAHASPCGRWKLTFVSAGLSEPS